MSKLYEVLDKIADNEISLMNIKEEVLEVKGDIEELAETITGDVGIDDDYTGTATTWSSSKISGHIDDIEQRLDDIEYKEINISSFTASPSSAENGATVNNVNLTWVINKNPVSLKLDNVDQTVTDRSKALTGLGLTANKTWSLVAKDNRDATSTKSVTLSFLNKAYWGAAAAGTYNSAFVLALANNLLTSTRARTVSVSAGSGQYVFYAIPHSFGTPTFTVGGFSGGFTKVASEMSFTNASGYTTTYDIWKSDNANLGSVSVVIS